MQESKSLIPLTKLPNLKEYGALFNSFRWEDLRNNLSGLPGGKGLNIGYEAVERHAKSQLNNDLPFAG